MYRQRSNLRAVTVTQHNYRIITWATPHCSLTTSKILTCTAAQTSDYGTGPHHKPQNTFTAATSTHLFVVAKLQW